MKRRKTQTLVIASLLMAMHVVLSIYSITLPVMKINLSCIPIIVGGFLFGPLVGMLVGFLGSFLYQLLSYGLMVTTILWMIPHTVRGLIVGLWAKKRKYKMGKAEMTAAVLLSSLTATLLNTLGIYIDSLVWGYEAAAFAAIGIRLLNAVLTSIVSVLIVIPVMKLLRKHLPVLSFHKNDDKIDNYSQ